MKVVALLLACLLPLSASANVIFPAFAAPYFAQAFSPVLICVVLLSEALIVWLHERPLTSKVLVAVAVVVANAVSWVLGVVLAYFVFPSGLGDAAPGHVGQEFWSLVWLAFPVAFLLSVLLEGCTYRLLSRYLQLSHPWRGACIANLVSYAVIGAVFLAVPGAF
jgi:hypothetical protein